MSILLVSTGTGCQERPKAALEDGKHSEEFLYCLISLEDRLIVDRPGTHSGQAAATKQVSPCQQENPSYQRIKQIESKPVQVEGTYS